MKERLVIKNFGPIKNADLSFGRFNVLIGEQATGKSTVAKLLAVCRYFSYLTGIVAPNEDPLDEGLLDWGLREYRHNDTCIEYVCEDYTLVYRNVPRLEFKGGSIEGDYLFDFKLGNPSERFLRLLAELEALQKQNNGIPYTFFRTSVASIMQNPLYLATERGSNFLGYTTSSLSGPIANAEKLRQIRNRFYRNVSIEPLGISYKSEENEPGIKKEGETTFHKLSNSASGYQSTVPIVLAIKSYSNPPERDERTPTKPTKSKTFIIEEPELNLFPAAQYELMKFLVDKTMNYGNTILIATHSPYILTALNDLILSAQTGKVKPADTNSIMDKRYWLESEHVSAYRMLNDGTCRNILDSETGLIHAEEIDEVSNQINSIYDELCEVKYGE